MEHLFLGLLVIIMIGALASGFPVAFALPGSAIISIGLAAFFGYLFEGDVSSYFATDGPKEWLTAGITNFRSNYWDVETDTLIAIPLFIFISTCINYDSGISIRFSCCFRITRFSHYLNRFCSFFWISF